MTFVVLLKSMCSLSKGVYIRIETETGLEQAMSEHTGVAAVTHTMGHSQVL